ncbi:MAG: hypothetical protein AB7H96_22335 [Vicinamibacterales bacterium]
MDEADKEISQDLSSSKPGDDDQRIHPFRRNLEVFISRVDSLADHIGLAMAAITQSNKQASARLEDFLKTKGKAVDGEKDAFTIPEDKFTEFRRLQRKMVRSQLALRSVPRGLTVALVSEFDAFMGATLKTYYRLKPEALNASQRVLTFAEMAAFGSLDAAKEHILEKEVESFLRSSHSDQFETLESKLEMPLRKDLAIWADFVELTERRNLFVHNDGVVNGQYLQVCKGAGYDCTAMKKGSTLGVPQKYFSRAHEVVYELAAKLSHVLWRKLSPEDREAADAHFSGTLIYDLVYEKRYRLARTLADFGASTFKKWGSDYFRRALVVNRAQAYIWDGNRDRGLEILAAEDWSAANHEFQLCVAALRRDFPLAIVQMRILGQAAGPKKEGFRDWPVFRELRREKEFQAAFVDVFGEPFATVTITPSAGLAADSLAGAEPASASADSSGEPTGGDDDAGTVH